MKVCSAHDLTSRSNFRKQCTCYGPLSEYLKGGRLIVELELETACELPHISGTITALLACVTDKIDVRRHITKRHGDDNPDHSKIISEMQYSSKFNSNIFYSKACSNIWRNNGSTYYVHVGAGSLLQWTTDKFSRCTKVQGRGIR